MQEEWPIWRLVTEKIVSLKELDERWTTRDIFKANAILDFKAHMEREAMEKSMKKPRRR